MAPAPWRRGVCFKRHRNDMLACLLCNTLHTWSIVLSVTSQQGV